MKRIISAFTILFVMLAFVDAEAQLFQQDFSTPLTIFTNGSSADPVYVNSTTPSNSQFTFLSANNANMYISVPATGDTANMLTFFRNGSGNGYFTRNVAFAGPPTALQVKFDFRLWTSSANSSQQPVNFYVGTSTTNSNSESDTSNGHSRFTIGFRSDGSFIVGPYTATPSPIPATYTGTQTITFVTNNSGSEITYTAPNGSSETLADDSYDLWVGTNKELDNFPARDGAQSLNVFKMRFGQSTTSSISIDNLTITDPPAPPSPITSHFRTVTSGDWNATTTWELSSDGVNWSAATVTPYDTSNTITVRTGHTVTVTATVNVDQVTVENGASVIVNGNPVVFTISDGSDAVDMNVLGLLKSTGTANPSPGPHTVNANGVLQFGNGGMYEHEQNSGAIPVSDWGTGSTLKITGTTNTAPANRSQNYYNLIFDCAAQTANLNMGFTNHTVSGDITIANTNTGRWYLCGPVTDSTAIVTLLGDVIHLNGNFSSHGTGNGNTTVIINHYGNINATNGNFALTRGSQAGTGTTSWNFYGNSISLNNLTTQNSNSAGARFYIKSNDVDLTLNTVTFGGGGMPIQVDSGAVLNMGTSVIQGTGVFTVSDYGTINTALDSGFVQNLLNTGTTTLSQLGNYGYNGTTTQLAGALLPASINGLLVNNAAGVTMTGNMTVNGFVNVNGGDLLLAGNTLTLGSNAVLTENAGSTVSGVTGKITITRDLNAPTGVNVGGLGAMLTTASNLGTTTVERTHAAASGNGNTGILRVFSIAPANNTGLNATLRFYYDESELNGLSEPTLVLFKSPSGVINTWNGVGGTVNTANNYVELSGLNDFSFWTLGSTNTPLPVELISFTASSNEKAVLLNWQTASEQNNKGWNVERKYSGSEWTNIGFVSGNGTTTETKSYSFTDDRSKDGLVSYRLKQIDFNGDYSYSSIIEVDVKIVPVEFALHQNFPNPFNPSTTINFEVPKSSLVNISVYNTIGEKVSTIVNETLEAGRHSRVFDASELSTGIYFYRLTSDNIVFTKKMLLVK
ncbi:MAG: T9SS type A sorting domain-containing protein [Ignavibacteriales bacterium]|nr:MAG: T9SS type A sorting domain-containing protein [Ignavibacteriales bacterium]